MGGQTLIPLNSPATRIALGDPTVADVRLLSPTELRLVGLKPGSTDLTIWSKAVPNGQSYSVVVGPNVAALKSRLAQTPDLQDVTATSTAGGVTLEGQAPSLAARQAAGEIARSEVGETARNQIAVADQRMVAVEVRFAAVSSGTMRALGLNFQKLGGGFQFATGVPGSIGNFSVAPGNLAVDSGLPIGQAFNLLMSHPGSDIGAALSALSSANLAQVLAEPTLLVRSGDEANFLAGGEIPIPVPQSGLGAGTIAIQYRKFGVQLHVHATVLSNERIVMRVNPEVSELDYQNALTLQGFNVPAIRARSTDTTIELGSGQSFVLAGLMYSASSNVEEKVPGLGSLPIIGEFFKRTQRSNEQQELVIIATPRLVSPMTKAPRLPGESLAYDPSLAETLLNTKQLDNFNTQYGLAKP
jgi:pilus assembly protein CpaC